MALAQLLLAQPQCKNQRTRVLLSRNIRVAFLTLRVQLKLFFFHSMWDLLLHRAVIFIFKTSHLLELGQDQQVLMWSGCLQWAEVEQAAALNSAVEPMSLAVVAVEKSYSSQ